MQLQISDDDGVDYDDDGDDDDKRANAADDEMQCSLGPLTISRRRLLQFLHSPPSWTCITMHHAMKRGHNSQCTMQRDLYKMQYAMKLAMQCAMKQ